MQSPQNLGECSCVFSSAGYVEVRVNTTVFGLGVSRGGGGAGRDEERGAKGRGKEEGKWEEEEVEEGKWDGEEVEEGREGRGGEGRKRGNRRMRKWKREGRIKRGMVG